MILKHQMRVKLTCVLKKHCVKTKNIRSFFWSVFSSIWTEYVNLRIKSEYREIRTIKNPVFGHFSRSEHYQLLASDSLGIGSTS